MGRQEQGVGRGAEGANRRGWGEGPRRSSGGGPSMDLVHSDLPPPQTIPVSTPLGSVRARPTTSPHHLPW